MVENYKILQDGFQKNGITQYIDVATLCKGRYMAALEMFQWIHGYFEQMGGPTGYDGPGRRKQTKCKDPTDRGRPAVKPAGMAKRQGGVPLKAPAAAKRDPPPAPAEAPPPARPPKSKPPKTEADTTVAKPPKQAKAPTVAESGGNSAETKQLKDRIQKLEQEVDQLAQERNFYSEKLRRVEDYCQENDEASIVQQILEILYEPDEAHGFLPPEDGE
jgi:RP/EB family microtubule-associated protein